MKLAFDLTLATMVLFVFDTAESARSSLRGLQANLTCKNILRAGCAPSDDTTFRKSALLKDDTAVEYCKNEGGGILLPSYYGLNFTQLLISGYNSVKVIPSETTTCGTAIEFKTEALHGGMILNEVEFFDPTYVRDNPAPLINNFTFGVEYDAAMDSCSCKKPCIPLPEDTSLCAEPEIVDTTSSKVNVVVESCPNIINHKCTRNGKNLNGVDEVTMILDLCDELGDKLNCCDHEKSSLVYMVSRFMRQNKAVSPIIGSFGEGISTGTLEAYTPFQLTCGM